MPFREGEKFLAHFLADNEKEAARLYKNYKRLISHLAYQFSKRSGVDAQDLFEEGLIGLARAKRDFEPERQVCVNKGCNSVAKKCECDKPNLVKRSGRFHNFAVALIRNALREAVYAYETPVPVPAYLKESNYYYAKMCQALDDICIDSDIKATIIEDEDARPADFGIEKPHSVIVERFKRKLKNRARSSEITYNELLVRAISIPRRKFTDIHRPEFSEASEEFDDERLDKAASLARVQEVLDPESYDILTRFSIGEEKVDDLAAEYEVTSGRISQIIKAARDTLHQRQKYIMDGDSPVRGRKR
jgi:RNA polymerase sigma factor (sigma-70 family)